MVPFSFSLLGGFEAFSGVLTVFKREYLGLTTSDVQGGIQDIPC